MTIKEYLKASRLTEAVFAERIGVGQSTVNRLRNGQIPGKALMARIYEETGGAVTANDFYGLGEAAA